MKIAFWGLGSIAKQHIVNLSEVLKDRGTDFQIDVIRHCDKPVADDRIRRLVTDVYTEQQAENKKYDIIFITNPTAMHYKTIQRCVGLAEHMFIEKPVFDRCGVNVEGLSLKKSSVYYVACPLRYTAVLQYVRQNIDLGSVYSARAISSSYLPAWRPGTDYRDTYSAKRALGGGVAIDLIHEWDYLVSLFGLPQQVLYAGGRYSSLEIDSDDLAAYIGIYKDKLVEVHLDYFGREAIRELILFTAEDTVVADLVNSRVCFRHQGTVVDLPEERTVYQKRELAHFLDIIEGKCENDNSIAHALEVLKIAEIGNQQGNTIY
ncbi:MAG: Gfo/Idh/MocA family oxidoreductase [Lachnospiraceae bacterium]|nr:Gfo/Idh/MocA family oxidoreductase [Lachnospiraceae bacterium]